MSLEDTGFISRLIGMKKEIEIDLDDDEKCHRIEDEMLQLIVFNMHNLSLKEMLIVQSIMKEIDSLEFARWRA